MAIITEIKNIAQPELDVYARLTEAQLRSKIAPNKGLFIAESGKVISHALDAGYTPVSFLMDRKHIDTQAKDILSRCPADIPVYTADADILAQLTGYHLTRGILCAMKRPCLPDASQICQTAKRIAVLEGIVDPTNVGAIFRSAAAMHMDAVLLSPTCCDPLHRRAVRVSMGTVFQIPWARLGTNPAHWPQEGFSLLKAAGFKIAALALTENAVSIEDTQLMAEEKLALLLGTEGDGLSNASIASSDYTVIIPMAHGVDSLNVAAAGAVAFWQLRARQ